MSSNELNGTAIGLRYARRAEPDYRMVVILCMAVMILALVGLVSIRAAGPADQVIYDTEQGAWAAPSGRTPVVSRVSSYIDPFQLMVNTNNVPEQHYDDYSLVF
jgi:hypothetical protein